METRVSLPVNRIFRDKNDDLTGVERSSEKKVKLIVNNMVPDGGRDSPIHQRLYLEMGKKMNRSPPAKE